MLGLWQLWTRGVTFVESRNSVWCPAPALESFKCFCTRNLPRRTSLFTVSLCCLDWWLGNCPFAFAAIIQPEFCTALTALDHTNTGVVLCPIDVEVTTPHKSVRSLQQSWQYQESNLAPSPLSSLLRTELWHTPESCDSPFLLNLCFHCLFR